MTIIEHQVSRPIAYFGFRRDGDYHVRAVIEDKTGKRVKRLVLSQS